MRNRPRRGGSGGRDRSDAWKPWGVRNGRDQWEFWNPRGARGGRDDRGGADTLFVIPLMFLMLLGILQHGLWAHAHHRAQAVATEALAAARAFGSSAEEGRARGHALAEDLGGTILRDVQVRVERGDATTSASVGGTAISLVPGWNPSVSTTLSGPTERVDGVAR
ncbi:pilus assembly protein [Nocardiopsis dassonvillei]|uniref:TadE family protein n=1 Tax=Nocardiopsis dassonvillei TaxID=2014 RepID=UPI0020A27F0F|nr:TadE family protein [Nocardiopsis dassonvillei]MCP3017197.1 pilus assembly protein [Nocardiopsis dassonvillei]